MPRPKFTIRFANGRILPEIAGCYDLEDCPLHTTLAKAVGELQQRIQQSPKLATAIQTLRCTTDANGDVIDYTPVSSGAIAQCILRKKSAAH